MQRTTESNRTKAYDYVRDEILTDPARHGTFLTEEEIAAEVGISRTPVREAFLLLAADGSIQLVPRHGAYVPPVTRQEIDDALQFRAFLECKAVEVVLKEGRPPLDAMEKALRQQVECSDAGQEREFSERDTEFHLALVRAVGNSLMTKVYADLRARQVRIGVRALMATPDRQSAVITEHRAIVDALRTGDVDTAVAALLAHIDTTASGLRNI